jgi:AcrR family transcriptional regulator
MARVRRTAKQARTAILDAAESLIVEGEGQRLRLRTLAERVGVSHPTVLHHFGDMSGVIRSLQERVGLRIRAAVLERLGGADAGTPREAALGALGALGDRRRGRLLAWLVADGYDPFPEASERGLRRVVETLRNQSNRSGEEIGELVEIAVLASLGDALFGDRVRLRLAPDGDDDTIEDGGDSFRRRLLERLLQVTSGDSQGSHGR